MGRAVWGLRGAEPREARSAALDPHSRASSAPRRLGPAAGEGLRLGVGRARSGGELTGVEPRA